MVGATSDRISAPSYHNHLFCLIVLLPSPIILIAFVCFAITPSSIFQRPATSRSLKRSSCLVRSLPRSSNIDLMNCSMSRLLFFDAHLFQFQLMMCRAKIPGITYGSVMRSLPRPFLNTITSCNLFRSFLPSDPNLSNFSSTSFWSLKGLLC